MTDHEWTLSEGSGVYCKAHHDRACMMSNAQAIAMLNEHAWMRREIVRVGDALYTTPDGHYTGTEEDLHAIGQTVEGVVDTLAEAKKN